MPPEFGRFLRYDGASRSFLALDDGPGEQAMPVVLATEDGSHAMGIFTPEPGPGYGRWRFREAHVVKWNCVFRVRDPKGVKPGDYRYRMFVVVGSLEDVRKALGALREEFPGASS